MNLYLSFLAVAFGFFAGKPPEACQVPANRVYELKVYSPDNIKAVFDITVTGYTLSKEGTQIPVKWKKENLKTPYELKLEEGKYTATIISKLQGQIVKSQITQYQGRYNMGMAEANYKKTIHIFGFGTHRINRGY